MNTDGSGQTKVTDGAGDKTDASFSPDGQWIVYSSDEGGLDSANLFIVPVAGGTSTRVSYFSGYDGAPSWSPDGNRIAFESCTGDPDESAGTSIWIVDVPELQ
jgi:TolB protein